MAREVAESFGADADRYDRARPRYPVPLLDRVLAGRPGAEVLDVGCGTGIVARQLLAAGCRVLGVDVDARMVELARQSGVEAEVAAFETWDTSGRTFDAVVSGQAWHWLELNASASKAASALRAGGRLAVFWNLFQPTAEVAAAFDAVYRTVLPENTVFSWTRPVIDAYAPILMKTADAIRASAEFGEPEEWRFTWEHVYTRDAWLDQVPTFGNSNVMPAEKLAALIDGLGAAIDELGGQFTMPYTTVAITAVRTAPTTG
ncbi:methyltransferase domain-containing protein [Actinospica durhamensis]|uniref:Methyltransferase domain-containing protein n=1 Tax=Actinospica durhamensis TaxID=1508375 RepID=A0A941INZ0_9ACTN|nr:class I SAM-dependent methyltransferase [Actinospica durhamensis]MBR7835950.1 methyltransferase domain-containing protein [Actinospica durhamensis]